jgi:hypothetical protein
MGMWRGANTAAGPISNSPYIVDTTTNQTQTRCKIAAKWSATLVARHLTAAETELSPLCRLIAGVGGRRRVHVRAQVRRIVRAGNVWEV